ncbi:hypothetical protein H0H92_015343 [Tricholoma furcatifolium]|nr:hypothetical protein H0H92_015343 [Tricholoma furcatifolium]
MAWRPSFNQGVSSFKESRLDEALSHFTQALKCTGGDRQHIIYDSRSAAYERLGMLKDALRDARMVIKLAPDQWQGYFRAARLFLLASKLDASSSMADIALSHIKPSNTKRRDEVEKLIAEIQLAKLARAKRESLALNQMEKLPVELLSEIFRYAVSDDVAAHIRILGVCSFWRGIAWNTPTLWSTLILTTNFPSRKIALWFKQSRGQIRELHVRDDVVTHPDWPFPELAEIAWSQLRIVSAASWDLAGYIENIKLGEDALSSLEELIMAEGRFCQRRTSPSLFPLLQQSRIRSLTFLKSEFSCKEISSLSSLTSICIYNCSNDPRHLVDVFLANPGLETVKITDNFIFTYSVASPISLQYLKHLELTGSWASSLLECIIVDDLDTLIIRASRSSLDRALNAILEQKGTRNLTRLTIDRCSVTCPVFIQFMKDASCLTQLELISLLNTNSLIEGLAGPAPLRGNSQKPTGINNGPIICPAMTYLDVSQSPDISTGILHRLIKSRLTVVDTAPSVDGGALDPDASKSSSPKCARIAKLIMDECQLIDASWLPWFRSNVPSVSCVYQKKKKKKASWR